jgi:alpha-amylase/alpha-mannosidase (GH57 family)
MAKASAQATTKEPQSPPTAETTQPQPPATERFACIHGHFYQPPRENPWLETVEIQDSAAPYHDWNDRITAECYAPNGASRITDADNEIIRIMNNYARMSFNFGPTLLSWLNDNAPRTYRMIVDADRVSSEHYDGHGSAMAQVYNHIIMPLANERDQLTQIRWGIADFESRFNRKPEGMWLAETAANRQTLDLLAREGIKFTILAPNQCARVRPIPPPAMGATANPSAPASTGAGATSTVPEPPAVGEPAHSEEIPWNETKGGSVDPRRAYLVRLNEGRSIAVFFYDGPVSQAVAFEGLLNSGEIFANRINTIFTSDPGSPAELAHIATDGESYGHHHRHGEMALSYAMHFIEEHNLATITNYGDFLQRFPPQWEAEIVEDTSWSCAHGVERWRSDCGCSSGRPGWNQQWRAPLRKALDELRDAVDPLALKLSAGYFKDLWAARDAYISVILDRSTENINRFLADQTTHTLSPEERVTALELMELQRHTQLMYTSCGWFFDEISGIETVQVIAYAGRVLQLAAKLFGAAGTELEQRFLQTLAEARSNVPEMGDGAEIYRRYVTGMMIGLEQVGAHYAISSIFRPYPEDGEIFCFDVHRESHQVLSSGRGRVALGRARIRSRITEEQESICFVVLHLGDQNLSAAVRRYDPSNQQETEAFNKFSADVATAIRKANLPEIIRLIDRFFGPRGDHEPGPQGATGYSLTSLFSDEQHRIIQIILNRTINETEDSLRRIYEDHASLLEFLTETGMNPPPALAVAANYAINASLRHAFEAEPFDADLITTLVDRAQRHDTQLNVSELSYIAGQRMKRAMVRLEAAASEDTSVTDKLNDALLIASTVRTLPFEVNIWQAQNIWNDLLRRSDAHYWTNEWKDGFKKLGETMRIKVDQLVVEQGVTVF